MHSQNFFDRNVLVLINEVRNVHNFRHNRNIITIKLRYTGHLGKGY